MQLQASLWRPVCNSRSRYASATIPLNGSRTTSEKTNTDPIDHSPGLHMYAARTSRICTSRRSGHAPKCAPSSISLIAFTEDDVYSAKLLILSWHLFISATYCSLKAPSSIYSYTSRRPGSSPVRRKCSSSSICAGVIACSVKSTV